MVKRRISTEDSVLLMSPKVIHGRPRPRLRCIDRGEVQGILTEGMSSAWKVGKVVGYVPIEKSRETFNAKGFFTDWDGFTLYVLGPVLRMAFWSSLFIALVSPVLLSQSHIEISEGMELVLMNIFAPFFYFPPLILVGVVVGIWLLLLSAGKFLKAVEDAVESMRLFIGQHKIQHDFEFRQVYECTPTTVSLPAVSPHHTAEEES
ncbi:hypothetical protein [Rothia mucilaginosa]|uniref:hypothetical protein n=1 Tax=Rothia mucilaginosa TaxID=43675 RepID=UPI0028E44575|nr:hypothetical protein [Rothia mucilaginosa]